MIFGIVGIWVGDWVDWGGLVGRAGAEAEGVCLVGGEGGGIVGGAMRGDGEEGIAAERAGVEEGLVWGLGWVRVWGGEEDGALVLADGDLGADGAGGAAGS